MPNDAPKFEFRGFRSPNYTQVPDELFDELMTKLSDSELRVLLYIIRRTFGFKKDQDDISLKQMVEGITTRDGRVIDHGTGLSKAAVARALIGLKEKKVITSVRNRSAERGNEATTYQLRFSGGAPDALRDEIRQQQNDSDSAPLSHQRDKGVSHQRDKGLSHQRDTQETVIQETDRDLSKFEGSHDDGDKEHAAAAARIDERAAENGTERLMPLGEILHRRAASRGHGTADQALTEPVGEMPPHRSQAVDNSEERERLRAFLADFAVELGDEAPLSSTITRTLTIFTAAGVPPERWGGLLYQARGLTQEHTAQIRKLAGDGGAGLRRKNKVPYFLATLESLVGLRPERADASSS